MSDSKSAFGIEYRGQGCFLVIFLMTVFGSFAEGQGPRGRQPDDHTAMAVRVEAPPALDGLLNDEVWSGANPATGFLQRDPQEGAPASETTEVRILFDTRNIYFGINCFDSDPGGIRATELRRDDGFDNDDLFELILDTFHDHRSGYLFRINPLGTQYDATITGEGQTINANWDEKWQAKASITESGWSAEIAIPFKTLRFLSAEALVWGVNFHRTIKRKNEDVFWTAHERSFSFEEVSRAGHLDGLRDIQGFILRLKPFLTTGASRTVRGSLEETDHLTDVGIEDAKYMLTPQLALDLTVNPDFAQADVDEAQVNLTRFSLFFPEKREFFQEGAGIFQFGTGEAFGRPQVLLFHSRHIGFSEQTREETPILGGLKLTGKQGPLDFGLLNMQTRRSGSAPGQNFAVARVKRNLLSRSYIGALYTRNTAALNGETSWAGGMDASFSFLQNLDIRGFFARNDAPRTSDQEWAGQGKAEWSSDRWDFVLDHIFVQANFNPEMGFVSRAEPGWRGMKRTLAEAAYKPRPHVDWIRQFEFSSSIEYIPNQDGLLETRVTDFGWNTDFESGDALDVEFSRNFERLLQEFRIRGGSTLPAGDYSFDSLRVMYRAFRGRPVSGNLTLQAGEFYTGNQTRIDVSPQIKFSQNFSIEPGYEWSRISLPGETVFTTHEFNGQMNYSFNQEWLTRTTFLLNSQDQEVILNLRLNYIYRPGDDLFVVYSETRRYGERGGLRDRAVILKLTHSWDF